VAASLQHREAARILGLQTAGARGLHPRPRRARGFATSTSAAARASREPNHEPTFIPDQSPGADQSPIPATTGRATSRRRAPSRLWFDQGAAWRAQRVSNYGQSAHAAGIEVILDVVYNHTAEGGPDGPTLSWRAGEPRLLHPRSKRCDLRRLHGLRQHPRRERIDRAGE
jgi:hypothetical protein